ncbi:MAG: hypothetical protein GX540_02770 [Clostridiales bacterium]|nr:hypothetical protein [Clostridiales bacterium]
MILLLSLMTGLAEGLPAEALFVYDRPVDVSLPLADGRVVYIPLNKTETEYFLSDELRCLDRDGSLLWACPIPPCRLPWSGLYQLPSGDFALIGQRTDKSVFQQVISHAGKSLSLRELPPGFLPMIPAGNDIYATQQGGADEGHSLFLIPPEGDAQEHALPVLSQQLTVLWAVPKADGTLLWARTRLSDEADLSRRKGDYLLVFRDAEGTYSRHALLTNLGWLENFGKDATPNHLGGLTALKDIATTSNRYLNTFAVLCFDNQGNPVREKQIAINSSSATAIMIDQQPDNSYVIFGIGKIKEDDLNSFIFRLHLDQEGNLLDFTARSSPSSSWPVRYLNNEVYVSTRFELVNYIIAFDKLPEVSVTFEVKAP